jgi:hypothetical protein
MIIPEMYCTLADGQVRRCEASAIVERRMMGARLRRCCQRGHMLRFLFLRFLPRRLVPLLTLFEIYRLFRRFQTRNDAPIAPNRRLSAGTTVDGTPRSWADRSA